MRSHRIVLTVVILLVIWGFFCLPFMKKDEFPQFTMPQGVVAVIYPGASSVEMEEKITIPLERYLFSFAEIDNTATYSITEDGICYTYVMLREDLKEKDTFWARLRHGLDLFKQTTLPTGVAAVVVVDDFGQTSSILLAVESAERSPRELEKYCQVLCDKLRPLKDIGNISISGQKYEEIAVEIDLERLSQYSLDQNTLMAQLTLQGFRTMGASYNTRNGNYFIETSIPYASEYELGEQIVYYEPVTGGIVRLRDIATITRRYKGNEKYVRFYENDLRASSLIVSIEMCPGKNIVAFGEEVQQVLDETAQILPPDIRFHRITDQPKVVRNSVLSFLRDLFFSIVVVILVMLFLFPLRTALVSSTSVPVCTAVALGMMYIFGIELNTVTLAALIVVLGMIVDDSVIIIDGYTNLLEKGGSRWNAAYKSTKQLFLPMGLATCSICGMFFPMTRIIKGPLGEFVQLFPWTVLFALVASIFYAVWIIPYLSTQFIKPQTEAEMNWFERGQNKFFAFLQNGYKRVLTICFRAPYLTMLIAILTIVIGGWLFTKMNIQMLPKADREMFAVEIHLQTGSDIRQTSLVADSLAELMLQDERVQNITSFVGQSSPRFHLTYAPEMPADNYAQFIVTTRSQKETRQLVKEMGERYGHYFPNAYVRFKRMDYQAVRNPIEVHLKGNDLVLQKQWADSIKTILDRDTRMIWIHSTADEETPTIRITLKPDEASLFGLTQTQLSVYLSTALGGQKLTTIWEGDYSIPVILYTFNTKDFKSTGDLKDLKNVEEIGNLLIPTALPNVWIPLRQVATIEPAWHPAKIEHWNNIRAITIAADLVEGAPATRVLKQLQRQIDEEISPNLPEGLWIEYGGLMSINDKIIPQLALSVVAALLVMLAFMIYHFGRMSIAILALVQSILCLFGTCMGLKIFNLDFSITALLGMVSLIGIIVRNAIIMYEYAEQLVREGYPVKQAAFEAGLRRMRPIFLTSATTALGVMPMIVAHTGLWMPMGVVICFGTILTFPLVVTVLPVTYWKFVREKREFHAKTQRRKDMQRKTVPLIFLFSLFTFHSNAQVLTLDSCLTLAKQNSYQIRAAQLDIAKAKEVKRQALTKYFPQVSVSSMAYYSLHPLVSATVEDVIDHSSSTMSRELLQTLYTNYGMALGLNGTFDFFQKGVIASATAVQPIFAGGQIINGNRLAALGVEAAELKAQIAERELLQTVEESYWLVVGLEDKQQTLQAAKALLDTIEHTVNIAVQAGLAIQNDLLRVQLKQNELTAKQLQLNNGLSLARQALALSIGLDSIHNAQCTMHNDHSAEAQPNYELCIMNYELKDRPETQLLDLQVRAARLQRNMIVGQSLPQVAVGASYAYHNLLEKNQHNGIAFVTLTVPITEWWETGHKLREQKYTIQQATEQRTHINNQLNLRDTQLYQQAVEAQEQARIASLSVEQANENFRLTELNYRAGRQTISELLEAQALLLQAQNALTDAQLTYTITLHHYQRIMKVE